VTSLAPLLQAFFTDRLVTQRGASPNTVASYRDTFRLLLGFAEERTGRQPSVLDLTELDAPLIGAFLDHVEHQRHNGVRTRNVRLAAIRSFFSYASRQEPAESALIQRVLAIPQKRSERALVSFLTHEEIEALLAAPDRSARIGRRDHALLAVGVQTGLRVSELIGLKVLGTGAHVACTGKGRKHRCTPLTKSMAAVLAAWIKSEGLQPGDPLFAGPKGRPLGRDAVESLVATHAARAAEHCSSIANKHVTPHVLRHSCAMAMLQAGIDTTVIALWLGHEQVETTMIYVHADMAIKQRALERTRPPAATPGRYRANDSLLAFLEGL
jgi:site-specific recombinase XerD